MKQKNNGWDENIPTVENCKFIITDAGTVVYASNGSYLGLFETEDSAVEMIRLLTETMEEV